MKYLLIIFMAVGLLSCGGSDKKLSARYLDDACAIKKQRKSWYKDMAKVQRKWGVPVSVQMATIYQESKFDGKARTPFVWKAGVVPMGRLSSAYGYSQAIDSTWDWYRKDQGKRGAKRDNFGDAVDFMGWYMDQSYRKNGIAKTDAYRQYLAYHDGHAGFARGSYRKKAWLPPVARSVEQRAILYQTQLRSCR